MAIEFYDSLNVDSNDDSYFLGDVGIGTTSPSEKLEVNGNVILDAASARLKLKGGTTGTNSGIDWTFNTDSTQYARIDLEYNTRSTNGLLIDSGYPITVDFSSSHFRISNNGSEKMRVNTAGNVGIGTTSPSAKLEVNGGFRAGGGGGANSEFEVEGGGDIITRAPLKCEDDIELNAGLADETGSPGSNNYILKSTGSAVRWITFPGVTSTTTGEPSGSSTVSNIVEIDQADYNTAAGNGTLVAGTVYLIT